MTDLAAGSTHDKREDPNPDPDRTDLLFAVDHALNVNPNTSGTRVCSASIFQGQKSS